MADLSSIICRIAGVLGALVVDRDGVIIEKSYLSEIAQEILEGLMPPLLQTVLCCEMHDPDLQHLRLRFRDLTIFIKVCHLGYVLTLCQNDVILYFLENTVESLLAETERSTSK